MQATIPFFGNVSNVFDHGRQTLHSLHGRARQFTSRAIDALVDPLGGTSFNLNDTLTTSRFANSQPVTLENRAGLPLQVRKLRGDDHTHLQAIYANMDENSRYLRFHRAIKGSRNSVLSQLAQQTLTAVTFGLLVVTHDADGNEIPVAVAYLVRTTDVEAELAISLRNDFQRLGIGTKLVMLLMDEARSHGFHRIMADVLNENLGMQKLLARLPYSARQLHDGYSTIFNLDIRTQYSTANWLS